MKKFLSVAVAVSLLSNNNISYCFENNNELNDINNHWAENEINEMINSNVLEGYTDNTFKPNDSITRAEFVKLTNNYFNLKTKKSANFNDINSSDWFYEQIEIAVGNGYIDGYPDNTFKPNEPITRQEAIKIICALTNMTDNEIDKLLSFDDKDKVSKWAMPYIEGAIENNIINGYNNKLNPTENMTRSESVAMISRVDSDILVSDDKTTTPDNTIPSNDNNDSFLENNTTSDNNNDSSFDDNTNSDSNNNSSSDDNTTSDSNNNSSSDDNITSDSNNDSSLDDNTNADNSNNSTSDDNITSDSSNDSSLEDNTNSDSNNDSSSDDNVETSSNTALLKININNKGFEDGSLSGWCSVNQDVEIVSSGENFSGNYCAKLTKNGVWQFNSKLKPNTTYTVKVKGMTEGNIDARLYVKGYGDDEIQVSLSKDKVDTTSITFTTGDSDTKCEFGVWVFGGSGNVYVDDFELVQHDDFVFSEIEKWYDYFDPSSLMTQDDFVKANGLMFKKNSGNGEEIILRGVNLGGWLVREHWMDPIKNDFDDYTIRKVLTERFGEEKANELIYTYQRNWITTYDLDLIKEKGFNCVRVPFWYRNFQNEDGSWIRKENGEIDFSCLDWIVNQCSSRGIYVVLDLHGAKGYQSDAGTTGKKDSCQLFEDSAEGEQFRQDTIDLWVEIAKHFEGNPAVVAYDLLNEPMGSPNNKTLWDFYDKLYDAIRTVDKDHIIMMEAFWDWNNLPNPKFYDWENVSYQFHNYDYDNVYDFEGQKKFTDSKIEQYLNYRGYNVPIFVGEFNGMALKESYQYILDKYNEHGFSWTTWSYKIKGYSSWGLMCNDSLDVVDITTDSYEEIKNSWVGFRTNNNFFENPSIGNIIENSAKAPYPNERFAPVTNDSDFINVSDDKFNFSAGENTTVSTSTEKFSGSNGAVFNTTNSGFPGNNSSCIKISADQNINASAYSSIEFYMKGTSSESHYVTIYDYKGRKWEGWIKGQINPNNWTKISIPLVDLNNGVDISQITEIRIGEWNPGEYYIDDFSLVK